MAIDINESKVKRNAFGLWLAWTLATTFGMILGYFPAALLVGYVHYGIARVVVPLLAGLLLGVAQWLVLRNYVNGSHDWILNHIGGWVVGYSLGLYIIQALSGFPLGTLIGFILFGVIVAVFQWPVLRREIPHLFTWILANVVAWAFGAFVSQIVAASLFNSTHPSLFVSTSVTVGTTGLVAGAITALALIWIVRQPDMITTRPASPRMEK